MNFYAIFERILSENGIALCEGGCVYGRSHKRGFVVRGERVVHLDRALATRSTFHRALHEVGHVLNAAIEKSQKSWEREAGAEKYATDTMRSLGIVVPRKVVMAGTSYVYRKYRHGRNIAAGRAK